MAGQMEQWDLWYPEAAATGLPFARSSIDPVETVLVHSAPEVLAVTVRRADGSIRAQGENLRRRQQTPMARLCCTGGKVEREDIWPGEEDIGRVVILPGGEAGVLKSWWNAEDHSEWRWQVEMYNCSGR